MRSLLISALVLVIALSPRPARAGDASAHIAPPPVAAAGAAAAKTDAPAADDDNDADDDDAAGIQEDVNASEQELEELKKLEKQTIVDTGPVVPHCGLMGPANPLHERISDAVRRAGECYDAPVLTPEGDAGGLLAELGGLDLAALKAEYDIPIEINADVIQYIRFFQGPGRKWYTHWLERSARWIPIMRPILAEEGVPLDLVYLAMIESGFSPYAYSWARASGFWQFISGTGRRFGLRDDFWVDERRDPLLSTRAAARYLKTLHDELGDWYLAWASYNAGEGKIRRAVKTYNTHDFWEIAHAGRILRKETKFYVPKLIAAALIAKHPDRFGFTGVTPEGPFAYDEVDIPDATDLQDVARAAGVTADELQQMNPSLRRWCTPPPHAGAGYRIKVPPGTKAKYLSEAAKTVDGRTTYRHHRVARGESLASLAKKMHSTVPSILKVNDLPSAKAMRAGMDLIIPMPVEIAQHVPDSGASWTEPRRHGRHGRSRWAMAQARHTVEQPSSRHAEAAERRAPSASSRYVVRSGDSLWTIARKFGVEVHELKRWNGINRDPRKLQVGRAIYVGAPRKAEQTASYHKGRG